MHARTLILSLVAAACPMATATAQTTVTYDDFLGSTISVARWGQFGETSKMSQANGFLRLFGRGFNGEFGVLALNGLQGDFDLVLKFKGFRAGGLDGSFQIFAFDSEAIGSTERELSVGMITTRDSGGKIVVGFGGDIESNGTSVGGGFVASTATAGEVRVKRVGKSVSLYLRAAGQTNFTQLGQTVSNFFVSDYVSFGIDVSADNTDGVDVFCDKITYVGKLVSGVGTYGTRCHGLAGIALGYPRLGNSAFRMIVIGGTAFRFDPFQFAIGLQPLAIPLTAAGAPGCSLYLQPLVVIPGGKLDDLGEAVVSLPVPNDSRLKGLEFQAQFVANTNRNAMGLAWSNGIKCKIW